MTCSMTCGYKHKHDKAEVLTANYPIAVEPEKRGRKEPVNGEEE